VAAAVRAFATWYAARVGGVEVRRPSLAERTRAVRWGVVVVLAVAAVAFVAADAVSVCEQVVGPAGTPVTTCRPPRSSDALTLSFLALLLSLLAPDVAEVGVPGLFSLRSRLQAQEERLALEIEHREVLESRLTAVQAQVTRTSAQATVTVVSGEATARYAGGGLEELGDRLAHDAVVDAARYLAAELLLGHLNAIGSGSLRGVNLRLYLPDEAGDVLAPVLREPAEDDSELWRRGEGVVGQCWQRNEIVVARGPEVTEGLSAIPPRWRRRYALLAIVVAVPVGNAEGRPIGVLSASSRDAGSRLDSPEAAGDLFGAAAVCARILVDLLGWANDQAAELGATAPDTGGDTTGGITDGTRGSPIRQPGQHGQRGQLGQHRERGGQ
jgi:hypothetical protein